MKTLRYFFFLVLLGYLCHSPMVLAVEAVQAEVNRTELAVGETLQLTITANGNNLSKKPNFSPLETDFSILTSAMKTQLMIINGESKASTSWQLTLSPKHAGDLQIPAFKLGNESSQPITIHVGTSSNATQTQNTAVIQNIYLQAQGAPQSLYVQSEGVYTLKLFYNQTVQNAQFSDPTAENATIFRIGQDTQYQQTINNRPYEILERHYAVIPHKPGDLTIEPPTFSGNIMSFGQFGSSAASVYASGWEPMSTRANPVTFKVNPIPEQAKSGWWLPAEKVTIEEQWSEKPDQLKVGQPITRTLTIEAVGAAAENLPDLAHADIKGMQIYPDKSISQTSTDGKILTSKRQQKFAMIPNKPGDITLPSVKIQWWNTKTDKMETVVIPQHILHITDDSVGNNSLQPTVGANSVANTPLPVNENRLPMTPPKKITFSWLWIFTTILFAIFWLITLKLWLNARHALLQKAPVEPVYTPNTDLAKSLQEARTRLQQACENNNPKDAKEALIQWAALQWPTSEIRHLGDVEKYISNEEAYRVIHFLDEYLYSQKNTQWDGQLFWEIMDRELSRNQTTKTTPEDELPKLHPEE